MGTEPCYCVKVEADPKASLPPSILAHAPRGVGEIVVPVLWPEGVRVVK